MNYSERYSGEAAPPAFEATKGGPTGAKLGGQAKVLLAVALRLWQLI